MKPRFCSWCDMPLHKGEGLEGELMRGRMRWYSKERRKLEKGPDMIFDYWLCYECTDSLKNLVRDRASKIQ